MKRNELSKDTETVAMDAAERDEQDSALTDWEALVQSAIECTSTPRDRLAAATVGQGKVSPDDVVRLMTGHLVSIDAQASSLSSISQSLVDMVFNSAPAGHGMTGKGRPDAQTALALITQLARLQHQHVRELRKISDLLVRVTSPQSPRVQIAAFAQDQRIHLAENQVNIEGA